MSKSPFVGLVIRTAAVRRHDLGFIYACDPAKEREEIPHAIIFKWKAGVFERGECEYDAHTICVIEVPESGLVDASGAGYYSINTRNVITTVVLFENSHPPSKKRRIGGIRSISEIAGKAYAVGLRGMVYRLDRLNAWTRIDDGLPDTFDVQAIHGFGEADLYAVGRNGDLWQFDGKQWIKRQLPTNMNLTSVKCAGDGKVYVAGHRGILIEGRSDQWENIEHQATGDDIWDIEWFEGQTYLSTMKEVYQLNNGGLNPVDFGKDRPKSCYQLSTAPGVMWSNGEHDRIMRKQRGRESFLEVRMQAEELHGSNEKIFGQV